MTMPASALPEPNPFAPPPTVGPAGFEPVAPSPGAGPRALAGPGSRLAARLIDLLVLFVPGLVISAVIVGATALALYASGHPPTDTGAHVVVVVVTLLAALVALYLASGAVSYGYFVSYQGRTGSTLGKRAMKIRTVRLPDGSPIDLAVARRRWLASEGVSLLGLIPLVGSMTAVYNIVDYLWLLWDKPLQQCLHDKYAQTVVVQLTPADLA